MTNEIQEKIKEIFSQIKSSALVMQEDAKEEVFLLAQALKLALEDAQKQVVFFSATDNSQALKNYKEKWQEILGDINKKDTETQFKTIIKIPKKDVSIKELAYNENEDFFSLVLITNSVLHKDTAIFEKALPEPDAIICFFDDYQKLEDFRHLVVFPSKDKTMFLNSKSASHNSENEQYRKTLSEKIINLVELLEVNFSQTMLNLIFAALAIETNNFHGSWNKEVFSTAHFLLSRGAEAKKINEILERQKNDSSIQLLGRFMARTHYDDRLNVSWSFLPKKDFEKTGADSSPANMLLVMKEAEKSIRLAKIYIMCWQNNQEIFSIIKSSNNRLIEALSLKLAINSNSEYLVLRHFKSFSEAEIKIKEALAELNSIM